MWKTYLIIFLCSAATSLTILSLSAIATNGKIKAGGTYYLLSRSLGPATGGAVGILFYFATLLSGAMYIIGAVEAFLVATGLNLGPTWLSLRLLSLLTLGAILLINWFGLNLVSKMGMLFLVVSLISIVLMFVGLFVQWFRKEEDRIEDISGIQFGNFVSGYDDG